MSLALANARLIADLDRERHFIQRILNTIPVVVTYIDRDMVFRQANEAAAQAFGREIEHIIGHRMSEVVNGNREMIEHVKTVFQTGKPLHTTAEFFCAGCEGALKTRHYVVTYVPDLDEGGQVVGVIHEAEDVTELQQLRIGLEEALANAEASKMEVQRALDRERQYSILLQRALLPEVPEVPEGYAVATTYVSPFAGREIGGDFYDVFGTERGEVAILIGDVAGKGLEAASIAAAARATVRAFAYEMSDTGEVLTHANAVLHSHRPSDLSILFVTLFLGILDPASSKIRYCSAGHPPPAVFHASSGEVGFLRFGDPPIGLLDKYRYNEAGEDICPGDKVVFYTDGISEARQDSDLFGEQGIERSLRRHYALTPQDLVAHLLAEATEWAGGHLRDDAALIVLERKMDKMNINSKPINPMIARNFAHRAACLSCIRAASSRIKPDCSGWGVT
ncbi:MAG: SpoIIE family protein phosphatase, partial [Armatimonadetes bacterium]|nr:SpoIIE family protein phosphatase [Armatimonadota bacterium]